MFRSVPVTDESIRALAEAVRGVDAMYQAGRREYLREVGLADSEFAALCAIADDELGAVTAKHLARSIGLTTSATTTLLDRLSAGGLLERHRHPTDRRSILVTLTPRGKALMTDAYQQYVAKFAQLVTSERCAPERIGAAVELLQSVAAALARPTDRLAAIA